MKDGLAPEVAYFDAVDYCDKENFEGVWSVYPFFVSRSVILSSKELGLFLLSPNYAEIGMQ